MAENTPTAPGAAAGARIENTQSTVDVLDTNGNELKHEGNPLADIFSKIEQGASASDAIKDVMQKEEKPAAKPEEKKEVTPPAEQKPEPSAEDKAKQAAEQERQAQEKAAQEKAAKEAEEKAKAKEDDDFFKTESDRKAEEAKKKADEDAKAAEAKAKEEDVTEEELAVLPHDKPKTARRIKTLLTKVDEANALVVETKKEAEAKAARLAELEKELEKSKTADPLQNEEVKKALEDLKMYRRRYELEKDPEVKTKFDSRVESAETSIKQTLSKRGAGEALIKLIEEEGGWLKFADSNRDITLANGDVVKAAELADTIRKALPVGERRAIEALEIEQVQTKRERERFFEEETKRANEYFAQTEAKTKAEREQQQKLMEEGRKLIDGWREKVVKENDWLQEKQPPVDATPEQKAAIEEDNKYTKQLQGLINKALTANKLDDMLGIVFDSVRYHQERRQSARALDRVKALEAQLAEKQAQLDKFKKASSSVPKGGSLVGGGSTTTPEAKKAATPESLEAAFEKLASGQSLTGEE